MGGRSPAPAYTGPQAAGAEPLVPTARGMLPLSQAAQLAQRYEMADLKTGELRQDITRAAAAQQKYQTDLAEAAAKDVAGKPKAQQATSSLLDATDRMESLGTKIRNDPSLWWTTGFMGSTSWPHASRDVKAVQSDINDLIGQVGNSVLQALRAQSATGSSGFGNTNETEINMVKNALAGLQDRTLSYEKYQENLDIVINAANRIRERTLGTWQQIYGEDFREPGGKKYTNPSDQETRPYPRQSQAELRAKALEEEKAANRAKFQVKKKEDDWKIERVD